MFWARVSRKRCAYGHTGPVYYIGCLAGYPTIGRSMFLFYEVRSSEAPRVLETAPVERVLYELSTRLIFAQTHNSVYQIEILDEAEAIDALEAEGSLRSG